MVPVLLFVFYVCLFSFLLYKIKFVRKTALPWQWLIGLFLLKVAAGCFYGYIHSLSPNYPDKIDTWKFYFESLPETNLLAQDPAAFFQHLFGNGYSNGGNDFLSSTNSFWNDLKHNIMIALMSIFNLFSGKNYYTNTVFFNFICFFGPVAFYRFCQTRFTIPSIPLVLIIFCIPSFVFWGSGFHKEGLLFTCLAFILYSSYKIMYGKKTILFSGLFAVSVLCIFFLRSYLLLFYVPYFFIWVVVQYTKLQRPIWIYTVASILFISLFFLLPHFSPKLNLPQYTSNAQQDFLSLGGRTAIAVDSLLPTPASFIQHAPIALATAFYAPGWQFDSLVFLPSILENTIILLLFIGVIFWGNKEKTGTNTSLFFLFFALATLLFLGYSVPIAGAIIRYKSILLPFLLIFLANGIQWEKLKNYVKI